MIDCKENEKERENKNETRSWFVNCSIVGLFFLSAVFIWTRIVGLLWGRNFSTNRCHLNLKEFLKKNRNNIELNMNKNDIVNAIRLQKRSCHSSWRFGSQLVFSNVEPLSIQFHTNSRPFVCPNSPSSWTAESTFELTKALQIVSQSSLVSFSIPFLLYFYDSVEFYFLFSLKNCFFSSLFLSIVGFISFS